MRNPRRSWAFSRFRASSTIFVPFPHREAIGRGGTAKATPTSGAAGEPGRGSRHNSGVLLMAEKKIPFRKRLDFSKIPATIQIPNLIEVQKRSYDRFLQMDHLPSERDDAGLQAVFQSVFPISDFRNVSQLEFVDYAIGNWECKCGHLKGLHHLRTTCKNCGNTVITDPFH